MDQATKLRERVQTNQEISNARVIAITSGKGGVGKTTLSVNIALELARRGKKVVVFDADFGLANVEVMLGIRPQYNLLDLIHNNKSMTEIITQGPEGIGFISGGSGALRVPASGGVRLIWLAFVSAHFNRLVARFRVRCSSGA